MRNIKILEMLNDGRIEELKELLRDEIYTELLSIKPGAKRRYAAMKKYFGYHNSLRDILMKPCPIEFEGVQYHSFTNSHSLVLTTESIGTMEPCSEPERYPDVSRLIHFDGEVRTLDFKRIFAEAKTRGYKLNKTEFRKGEYLMRYDGAYFKLSLLDSTFAIIDNGEEATVYKPSGANRKPIVIRNDIGIAVIMPMFIDGDPDADGRVVIEADPIRKEEFYDLSDLQECDI